MIDEPGADDEQCSTPPSMTMHCNLPLLYNNAHVEDAHDSHHVLECRGSHVLPAFAETVDPLSIETFWNVTETNIRQNTVSTVRMLSRKSKYLAWLLQIKDSVYS